MLTVSWCAWLALRRRVSMSAMGSVIVMAGGLFLLWFRLGADLQRFR